MCGKIEMKMGGKRGQIYDVKLLLQTLGFNFVSMQQCVGDESVFF